MDQKGDIFPPWCLGSPHGLRSHYQKSRGESSSLRVLSSPTRNTPPHNSPVSPSNTESEAIAASVAEPKGLKVSLRWRPCGLRAWSSLYHVRDSGMCGFGCSSNSLRSGCGRLQVGLVWPENSEPGGFVHLGQRASVKTFFDFSFFGTDSGLTDETGLSEYLASYDSSCLTRRLKSGTLAQ
jgi:hypothetical protein